MNLEDKKFELKNYIADKFRDLQLQSQSLKIVEDEVKNLQTLSKMVDFINEVRRSYGELSNLEYEEEHLEENENEKEEYSDIYNF